MSRRGFWEYSAPDGDTPFWSLWVNGRREVVIDSDMCVYEYRDRRLHLRAGPFESVSIAKVAVRVMYDVEA